MANAKSYAIYRKVARTGSWTQIATTTKLTYTDKTAKKGISYVYSVRGLYGKCLGAMDEKGLYCVCSADPAYAAAAKIVNATTKAGATSIQNLKAAYKWFYNVEYKTY